MPFVSIDNCSHNGTKLYKAVSTFARKWVENGQADKEFGVYSDKPEVCTSPGNMIDKITPTPDASVKKMLLKVGF